jgi:Lanthionine synthetase C-like protein/HopA1 effector protein family
MCTDVHIAKTLSAIQAATFRRSSQLCWLGVPVRQSWPDEAVTRELRLQQLTAVLYQQFYCHGRVLPLSSPAPPRTRLTGLALDRLADAQRECFRWERGWQLLSADAGNADAKLDGLRALVHPAAWRHGQEKQIEVRLLSGSFTLSPGFYLITGDEPSKQTDVVRIYWNVTAGAAGKIISAAEESLGRRHIPYRLKVLTDLTRPGRADRCVLYLQRQDFASVRHWMARLYRSVAESAAPAVPVYTLQIADGLSVAEQPPGQGSFGQHRCGLLAEGIMLGAERKERSDKGRLATVSEHFSDSGYPLECAHLNPGSVIDYSIPVCRPAEIRRGTSGGGPAQALDRGKSFVEVAAQIGEQLVRTAIWFSGRCNWVGRLAEGSKVFGSLGTDLYSGSSGIAWFLAELSRLTGREEFRHTAQGAMIQAFEAAAASPRLLGKGLYTGWAGIAYAAWRCASLLDEPELHTIAERSLAHLRGIPADCVVPDLISGEAGAILLLLLRGDEKLAEAYGYALLNSAKRIQGTWSWRTTSPARSPHLLGMAHGTAGIATALGALYRATGSAPFSLAARGAFQYERSYFSPAEGNWADFRGVGHHGEPRQYACAWCHGAPGIALSRHLAMLAFGQGDELESELMTALETTRTTLVKGLEKEQQHCICHGMLGNADILHLVGMESDRDLVRRVGEVTAMRLRERIGDADSGFLGLMTGIAGIGHYFLRLQDPEVTSPLLIGPELWHGKGVRKDGQAADVN